VPHTGDVAGAGKKLRCVKRKVNLYKLVKTRTVTYYSKIKRERILRSGFKSV
jgi:hypothetical protein